MARVVRSYVVSFLWS